jgi:hypothetical protein
VGAERWFYRDDDEWSAMAERLKQTPCPHCRVVGTLIRHGFLYGFDDRSPQRKTLRARRVFCSNRQTRPGCGQTFSVWLADKIRRLSLSTGGLWRFLQRAVTDGIRAAVRGFHCQLCDRTLFRIWQRFQLAQSKIRAALSGRCSPPELPAGHRPEGQTLAHVRAAFPVAPCPVAAFQQALRTFFV